MNSRSKQDLAAACGLNLTTVTLALNNHPRVAERTRERVQETARRLGYTPNIAARRLAFRRHAPDRCAVERVALILFDSGAGALQNVYLSFLVGIEERVAELTGTVTFLRESPSSSGTRLPDLARSDAVDGFILCGAVDDSVVRGARRLGRPFVVLGDYHGTIPVHQTTADFRGMGRLAVEHLLELGHRRIGFSADRLHYFYQRETVEGAREAMRAVGLNLELATWFVGESPGEIRNATPPPVESLLDASATAIIVGEPGRTDRVLAALAMASRRVPDDVSVLGCEERDAWQSEPELSCVNVTMSDVGAAAVDLLRRISADPAMDAQRILIPPRLVEGKTCGRIEQQTGGVR